MSEGNGHPYSWSAICNGYNADAMAGCGFPVIPQYLAREEWPQARLSGVEVTHVWTQERELSEHVARASRIPNVVESPDQMLGEVDAVLLARDDAENHLHFAAPFLAAGVPIYIDKPIALSLEVFETIMDMARSEASVFTCSAMRYASELRLTSTRREQVGTLRVIEAETPKAWDTYAVHLIDPVLAMLADGDSVATASTDATDEERRSVEVEWASGVRTRFTSLGHSDAAISIRVVGDLGQVTLTPQDTFTAFRAALADFRDSVRTGEVRSSAEFNRRVVQIIELGRA